MSEIILLSISKVELEKLIENAVLRVIGKSQKSEVENNSFLDIHEASKLLKLAPQTLYGLTSKRLIPFIKKRRKLLFHKNDLDKWAQEGRKKPIAEL